MKELNHVISKKLYLIFSEKIQIEILKQSTYIYLADPTYVFL